MWGAHHGLWPGSVEREAGRALTHGLGPVGWEEADQTVAGPWSAAAGEAQAAGRHGDGPAQEELGCWSREPLGLGARPAQGGSDSVVSPEQEAGRGRWRLTTGRRHRRWRSDRDDDMARRGKP